jgi:hypothetical protein
LPFTVEHLHEFAYKIQKGPHGIRGKLIHEKNPEVENLVSDSLYERRRFFRRGKSKSGRSNRLVIVSTVAHVGILISGTR